MVCSHSYGVRIKNGHRTLSGARRAQPALTLVTMFPVVPRGRSDLTAPSFPPSPSTYPWPEWEVPHDLQQALLAAGTVEKVTGQQDGAEPSGGVGQEARDTMGGKRSQKFHSWREWPHLRSLTPPGPGPQCPAPRPSVSGPQIETPCLLADRGLSECLEPARTQPAGGP